MLSTAIIDFVSLAWKWIPIRGRIVYKGNHAIRWWFGKPTRIITKPGLQVYIPWISTISMAGTIPMVMESEAQFIGLLDGSVIGVSLGVHYQLEDILKWYFATVDFEESFLNKMQMATTEYLSAMSLKEWSAQNVVPPLRKKLRRVAEKWGVRIIDINFVNSGKVRPLHITGISIGDD